MKNDDFVLLLRGCSDTCSTYNCALSPRWLHSESRSIPAKRSLRIALQKTPSPQPASQPSNEERVSPLLLAHHRLTRKHREKKAAASMRHTARRLTATQHRRHPSSKTATYLLLSDTPSPQPASQPSNEERVSPLLLSPPSHSQAQRTEISMSLPDTFCCYLLKILVGNTCTLELAHVP